MAATVTIIFLPTRGEHDDTSSALRRKDSFAKLFTRPLVLTYALQLVLMITNGVVMAIWNLYMLDRGATLPQMGLSYTTFALPIIFIAPISGRLSDRYGEYWLFLLGLFLTGVIFCIYSLPSVTAWPIIIISIGEGVVTSIARASLDGLLADAIPPHARGKVQANYTAAGLIGNLLGATAAGLLYGYSTGLPFLVEGLVLLGASMVLLLPGIARMFLHARQDVQDEYMEEELIEEKVN